MSRRLSSGLRANSRRLWRWHRGFVWSVAAAGNTLAVVLLVRAPRPVLPLGMPGFWLLVGLLLVCEVQPLVTAGSDEAGVTTSTLFVFVMLLRWGLPAAVAGQAAATVLESMVRRKAVRRAAFNVAQFTISLTAAAVILRAGGAAGTVAFPQRMVAQHLPVMLAAAVVYFAVNDVLVCHAIALGTRARTWRVLRADLTYQLVTTGALLVMAPLVVLALDAGSVLVLLLLPPLGAVYANGIMSQRTQHAALHDPLTGLANRTELTTRAARTFDQAACGRRGAAVIVVDLDRFKQANDSYGHQVGDRLLCLVAARLSAQLRPADTAARLGGDEFVILAAELRCAQEAEDLRTRLNAVLTEPFRVDDVTIFLGASIGVALYPDHGPDLARLLPHADADMYRHKRQPTLPGTRTISPP